MDLSCEECACITPKLILKNNNYVLTPATLIDQTAKKLQKCIDNNTFESLPKCLQKQVLNQAFKDNNTKFIKYK